MIFTKHCGFETACNSRRDAPPDFDGGKCLVDLSRQASTDDDQLRHASFKGLRDIADNVEIYDLPT